MAISTFRAFKNRNYTLFFTGQLISQVGTWMQRTGVSWVVYTMTHSTVMLGLTIFAAQFPSFLFSLPGGIVADRFNRHKVLLITQSLSLVQALLLAILVFTNHYAVWQILALSVMLGIVNAFDVPARQPLVNELIKDKADLPNAIALNSSMVNLAMLVGPALSGLVLVKFGAGICFLSNALSFVAVLISLLVIKLPPYKPSATKKKISSELSDGFMYLKKTPAIAMVVILIALVSLLVIPYNTVLPVFAKVIFKGNAATFGFINSFIGLGALAGAFFLASLKRGTDLKIVLLANLAIFGGSLILFSLTSYFPLAMLFAAMSGFGMMSQSTVCITIAQVESSPEMRGRVISYLVMAITGMLPLGSLLVGIISQHIGSPHTLLIQGVIALVIAGIFLRFLKKDKLKKATQEQLKVV
ncbi:MAG TPA: MFS transporter [Mucilaginibacter sp.]|jgi:MFS family permease|nr:MFS transporter [Mucilaginibacter sp.]